MLTIEDVAEEGFLEDECDYYQDDDNEDDQEEDFEDNCTEDDLFEKHEMVMQFVNFTD